MSEVARDREGEGVDPDQGGEHVRLDRPCTQAHFGARPGHTTKRPCAS